MKDLLNQGVRSLAPHRSEAPYCKVCYCEIIHSGKHTLFGVRVITNQALSQHTMISYEDIKNSSLHKRFEILQLNHL